MNRIVVAVTAAFITTAALVFEVPTGAHRTAVSPYTFHRDVVPILEARCGRCHADGSVSGVALLRYAGARNVIWPMRQSLVSGHMPPWFAEGPFKAPTPLSGHELNVLMTWATGGAPEGRPAPRELPAAPRWPLGAPDLQLSMPAAFAFINDQSDVVHEVTMPAQRIGGRLIRAVDLQPGTPAIVRGAELVAKSASREQVIGLWQPGDAIVPLEANAAFRVPATASIVLRLHYRRQLGQPLTDRSVLGLYFAAPGAAPVREIALTAEADKKTLQPIASPVRAVALRPISGPSGSWIQLMLVSPDGTRHPLARLQLRSEWNRRYVFDRPIVIADGSKIETGFIKSDDDLWTSLIGDRPRTELPVRVALEVIDRPN